MNWSWPSVFQTASKAISTLVMTLGAAVLVGWVLDIGLLKSILPTSVAMKADTALTFILCGVSLWLLNGESSAPSRRVAGQICAAAVALVGLLTLVEYWGGWNLGINQRLFQDSGVVSASSTWWMAPPTALNFLFLGLAFLFVDLTRGVRFVQPLALFVALTGYLTFLGYVFGASTLFGHVNHTYMAIHTASAFMLLGLGVLFARPERGLMGLFTGVGAGGKTARRLLLPIIIVLPVLLGLGLWGYKAGLYGPEFGLALMAVLLTVILTTFILAHAGHQNRAARLHRQAEYALEVSESRYRRLFECAKDGILILDAESGKIVDANPFLLDILGYTLAGLLGKQLWEIGLFQDRGFALAAFKELQEKQYIRYENLPLITKDGRQAQVEFVSNVYLVDSTKVIQCNIRDITARKQLERVLREREENLAALFEDAPVGYHELDVEGRMVRVNRTELAMLGYTAQEMLGRPVWEFVVEQEDSRTAVLERLMGKTPTDEQVERHYRRKDGTSMAVLIENRIQHDEKGRVVGIRSILQDITKRKRAEEALQESEQSLHHLFDQANDAIFIVDLKGRFLDVNQTACERLEYSREELLSRTVADIDTPEAAARVPERLQQVQAQQQAVFESEHVSRSGRRIPVEINSRRIEYQGQPAFLSICRDITERKRAEKDLAEQIVLAELSADIGYSLTKQGDMRSILNACTEALVRHLDVAFARIWTLNAFENILELQASAGIYTRIDGSHSRVPVGKFKIGLIAEERQPHITNTVIGDPRVNDQEWAKREGMVAFAGHPLIVEDRLVGVMGMFSRKPLTDVTLRALASVSNEIAMGIERKQTEIANAAYARQQAAVAKLGQYALATGDLQSLLDHAVTLLTRTLHVEYAEVLELLPNAQNLLLRAGAGWKEGRVGHTTVGSGADTQAGYTLHCNIPVIVEDLSQEARFHGSALLRDHGVVSGMSVIIPGPEHSFGVLGVQSTRRVKFADNEVHFLQAVASIIATAIKRLTSEEVLHQTLVQAQAANQAKTTFLNNMSHELRTPMNGILGMTELLLGTNLDAEQKDCAQTVYRAGEGLLSILNDVLDLSLIESGRVKLEVAPFDLDQVLGDVVELFRPGLMGGKVELVRWIDPELPGFLLGDSARLRQILVNLVSNAVKYTAAGSIMVSAQCEEIKDRQVSFSLAVVDTGEGIPPDYLPKLYQPFSQADLSSTRRHGGMGLGLVNTKKLVDLMGGEIEVVSTLGVGTAFVVHLKLPISQDEALTEATLLSSSVGLSPSSAVGRVLLVEDNLLNQRTAKMMLIKLGMLVTVAGNGQEALAAMEKETFDLVLMDVQMPVMDGYEATQAIRKREAKTGHHVPIVAMTAYVMKGDRERCLAAGMDDYLGKPMKLEKLRDLLGRWQGSRFAPASGKKEKREFKTSQTSQSDRTFDERRLQQLQILFPNSPHEYLDKALHPFLIGLKAQLTQLAELAKKGEWGRLADVAHRMQGAASNIGATCLAKLAQQLVTQALLTSSEEVNHLLEEIQREAVNIKADIARMGMKPEGYLGRCG